MKRRGCLTTVLLVPAGIVALVAGWFLVWGIGQWTSPHTVEGTVIDLIESRDTDGDRTYAPVVEYEIGGVTYVWESSVSYGGLLRPEIGDRRTLVYDPDNPSDARGRSLFLFIVLPGIFLGGAVLFGAAVLFFGARARRRTDAVPKGVEYWQLPPPSAAPGPAGPVQRIEADFMGVEPSPLGADGTVRYRIKAKSEVAGVVHRFTSDWLDEDPTLQLMETGNKVVVRIDPADPSRYEVELPDL